MEGLALRCLTVEEGGKQPSLLVVLFIALNTHLSTYSRFSSRLETRQGGSTILPLASL
ncbi:hypothetical protein KTT_03190 [Tengunoibacter tsumagoiensis]|uniref:Uncharacterized protein n=1 Tax=Tengunoibacter tsumagoiensis TaxID=2014871 RepID=A0A401ZUQ2_9CHLR|nr:hypothetical protein KTT_03190 [Tengunoibacter tsumagoiensis]